MHKRIRVSKRSGIRRGGGKLTNAYIYGILRNPAYAGYVKHYDKLFSGEHEAIISREVWESKKKLLKENSPYEGSPSSVRRIMPFQRIVRCGYYGGAMKAAYTKKTRNKTCRYLMPDTNSSRNEVEANERELTWKEKIFAHLDVTICVLDIFTTFAIIQYLALKYHAFIFPKRLVDSLGERVFPVVGFSFALFLWVLYISAILSTLSSLLKRKKYNSCTVLLLLLLAKDVFFIVLRLIEKYNL